jgi:predicted O-methyltransferase YrrM
MDTSAFLETIADVYGGDLLSETPTDRRFRALMDRVEGMGSENKLALLNHAARLLDGNESYVEVGTWKGLSLIAATLGNDTIRFYAFDDFSEAHSDRDDLRRALTENLDSHGVSDRVEFAEGDAFSLLPVSVREPIGVYFYDGDHSFLAHHLALAVAEPLLADEALVIIDDFAWPSVRYATERYIRRHQGYTTLLDLPSRGDFDPRWWTGLVVYRWRRPPGWRPPATRSVFRIHSLVSPLEKLVHRFLARHQAVAAVTRRLLPIYRVRGP